MIADVALVPLSEILTPVSRPESVEPDKIYSILGAHWYAGGLYIKDRKSGSEIQADKVYRVEQGDFIYNRLFAWKGSFAVVTTNDHNCYVSNEFPTFVINQNRVDAQYLLKYFSRSSIWDKALGLSSGGTPTSRNRLKEEKLLAMEIPLPSLEEQQRIVTRIEELSTKIEEARRLRQQSIKQADAVVSSALETVQVPSTGSTLSDYITIQHGCAFESHWFTNEGIRLVRNINIGHGSIRWDDTAFLPETRRHEFKRFELCEGDILLSLNRPIISTGVKVIRVKRSDIPSLLVQRVGRVIFHTDSVLPDFFFEWLNSPQFISALYTRLHGVPYISSREVERLPFNPPSLDEQHRVVEHMRVLRTRIDIIQKHQEETAVELDALLPSILDKAFKGKL